MKVGDLSYRDKGSRLETGSRHSGFSGLMDGGRGLARSRKDTGEASLRKYTKIGRSKN